MPTAQQEQELSEIGFYQGDALLLVSGQYPTLVEVVYESVQNCIDAEASRVWVTIDHKKCSVIVCDDGSGTTRTKFEEALTSVCYSLKKKENKLGQFGMGLFSPIGKCEYFTFTSTSKNNPKGYLQWTFVTEDIRKQRKIKGIPVVSLPNLSYQKDGHGGVPWRTQVKIVNFKKDRLISKLNLDSVRDGILDRFAVAMRKHNVVVEVKIINEDGSIDEQKIVADAFEGKKLPVEIVSKDSCGRTTFNLYLANNTAKGRQGKVTIGEDRNDYRLNFSYFVKDVSSLLSKEVGDALTSGIFEGEILTQKSKLDPTRRYFQHDEALLGLCEVIQDWYDKVGRHHVVKIKEGEQEGRYQSLGLRSMQVIDGMLKLKEFSHLMDVVNSFKVGTVGEGHAKTKDKKVGEQETPSLAVYGGVKPEGEPKNPGAHSPDGSKKEHKEHTPYTVSGPRGQKRTMVKGSSLGLQFLYEEMEGSSKLWDLDNVAGILRYNTRHPLWAQCEVDDKVLMKFQEYIAINALSLELVPDDWKERHRQMVDDSMPITVFWIQKGDELSGRKPGSALANYQSKKKEKSK